MKGYTLAEILIVVSIIVILGLAALIGLNPQAQFLKGFDTRRKADLNKIKIAFESYYSDHDCYPPTSILQQCGSDALAPYLPTIPCDPNDNTPYSLKVVPEGSTCPQQYAIYASIYSFFDKLADQIPGCPQTFAVYSQNMTNIDLIEGCTGEVTCVTKYGCKNGVCTIVGVDAPATCRPSSCDSDCGGINCAQQNVNGNYINQCVDF